MPLVVRSPRLPPRSFERERETFQGDRETFERDCETFEIGDDRRGSTGDVTP